MERKVKPHKENSKEKAWRHACLEKKKKKQLLKLYSQYQKLQHHIEIC